MKDNVVKIKLDLKDVKNFARTASTISKNVTLGQHRMLIDGKSYGQIFFLNLSKPVDLIFDTKEDCDLYKSKFTEWIIKGDKTVE